MRSMISGRRGVLAAGIVGTLLACGQAAVAQQGSGSVPAHTVAAFDAVFGGPHAAARAVHAKGVLLEGSFAPAPTAASLTRAVHLNGGELPILVRFSNFAGVPGVADGAPEASPRGFALRFLLPDDGSTDIVAHSYNGFPAATPDEFLGFLHAVAAPATMPDFAAARPAVRAFLDAPKPTPASYATETYFGVNAFRFTDASGASSYGRYRVAPLAGEAHLSVDEAARRPPDFLRDEIGARLVRGPVGFRLLVQVAAEGDAVADGSVPWPEERKMIELGVVTLRAPVANQQTTQQELRFMPTNLVGGIAPSADPMLAARTKTYRMSADRRGAVE